VDGARFESKDQHVFGRDGTVAHEQLSRYWCLRRSRSNLLTDATNIFRSGSSLYLRPPHSLERRAVLLLPPSLGLTISKP
jgi:hypothetical protein